MKFVKRLISFCLVIITTFVGTGILSSCAKQNSVYITNAEWIAMIDEGFGMNSYNESKPYIKNVTADKPYFDAVQIACEWNVIDKNQLFEAEKPLRLSYALITLVNCGDFVDNKSSDDEKISYALGNFKVRDIKLRKSKLRKKIDKVIAKELLESAKNAWSNYKYLTCKEDISYAENVTDFSKGDNAITDYTISDNGSIAIPKRSINSNIESKSGTNDKKSIEKGDVYILPSNGKVLGTNAYKADEVTEDDNNIYIKNSDEELDLYDIAQDIDVEESFSPTADKTIVYDGNGEMISSGNNIVSNDMEYLNENGPEISILGLSNNENSKDCATKVSHKFKVEDYSVNLEYDLNGKFDLKAKIENKKEYSKTSSLTKGISVGISDLDVTQKVDYKHFKLKQALMKVNYKTNVSVYGKYSNEKNGVFAPKMSNGNGKYLTNLKKAVLKDKDYSNGAKTIKICSLDVWSIGVCRLCLDVNLQIKIDGTVTLSVTQNGSKGAEYKNGNLRLINTGGKDVNVEVKAKVEGTIGIGPALYVVGLKKAIIGVQIKFGVGMVASLTIHIADSENHLIEESSSFNNVNFEDLEKVTSRGTTTDVNVIKQIAKSQGRVYRTEMSGEVNLHFDTCIDMSAYAILKIELTDTSYAAKLLGGKITTSWEILGEKNAKFLNIHIEHFNFKKAKASLGFKNAKKDQCTLKYKPFDQEEITTEESDNDVGSNKGFATNKISYTVNEGSKTKIVASSLPKGYSNKDIIFKSEDDSIATVSSDGTVTGKSSGTVIIKVSTKDNKYYTECVVYVIQNVALHYVKPNVYEYCYV